jgi:diguanylate cyclase (GGDEF)-like protein
VSTQSDPNVKNKPKLHLRAALQLLRQSGQTLPELAAVGKQAWLQALVDGLCELSSRDPLTGLANRRQFDFVLAHEIDRVARAGDSALMLVVDIDQFKKINDEHGHPAGDVVVKGVAQALQECIRPMDTAARLGGDEFAIILPNCPPAFGQAVAERVRKKVQGRKLEIAPGEWVTVTVSVGGGFAPQWVRSSASQWIERADRQLYRAKAEGRNRVCLEHVAVSQVSADERRLLFATESQELE